MEEKLQHFIDEAFAPYGDFPAQADIKKELLTNLRDKYNDFRGQGMSEEEAFKASTDSFGDVEEIMEQIPHTEKKSDPKSETEHEQNTSIRQILKETFRQAKSMVGLSRFAAQNLVQSDLSDSDLAQEDFSYSALKGTVFDRSNLTEATFRAASLEGTSYIDSNMTKALFAASDLHESNFNGSNLTGTKFKACALYGANFDGATLTGTDFRHCDLSGVSFEGQELDGVVFSTTSLKNTSFKNAALHNASFHYSEVKKTIFEGTKMDKVTYALLKGAGAVLDGVVII